MKKFYKKNKKAIWIIGLVVALLIILNWNKISLMSVQQPIINDSIFEQHLTADGSCKSWGDCNGSELCLVETMKCAKVRDVGTGCYSIYDFDGNITGICLDYWQ